MLHTSLFWHIKNNMSDGNLPEYQFSPFYRVRRILMILRLCFGFPLTSRNVAFSEMSFKPCKEYTRYVAFFSFFIVSISFVMFKTKELNNLESYVDTFHHYFEGIGFTVYDSIMFHSTPYLNMISTIFYLYAFKNNFVKINKICTKLTVMNKSLNQLMNENGIPTKRTVHEKSTRVIVLGITFSILIQCTHVAIWSLALENGVLGSSATSMFEKYLVSIAFVIYNLCWTYPTIAMSADFIAYHILNEIKHCFESWNRIFKHVNKKHCTSNRLVAKESKEADATENIDTHR